MRVEEAVRLAKEMEPAGITELHIVNGLHPTLPWRYYPRVLKELKAALPGGRAQGVHRHRDPLVREDQRPVRRRGARRADRRRPRVAHRRRRRDLRLGDPPADRRPRHPLGGLVAHPPARALRRGCAPRARCSTATSRSRATASTTCCGCASCRTRPAASAVFIPLRYQHDAVGDPRNRLQDRTTMATGAEALKTFAVSRLLFDNVPHVKNFWVMHGLGDGVALAVVRRRRPRRQRRRVQDHARRRRLRHAQHDDPREPARPHPRGGLPAGRARHPLRDDPRVRRSRSAPAEAATRQPAAIA